MTTLVTDAKFTNMKIIPKQLNALYVTSDNMPSGVKSILTRTTVDGIWEVPEGLIPENYRRVSVNADLIPLANIFDDSTQHGSLSFATFYDSATTTYTLELDGVYRFTCSQIFSFITTTTEITTTEITAAADTFINNPNDERGFEVTISNVGSSGGQVLTIAPKYTTTQNNGRRTISVGNVTFQIQT